MQDDLQFCLNRWVRLICFVLLLGLLPSPAIAQLKWAQPVKELLCATTDLQTEADFEFTNSGSITVKIVDIKSSCGCTTAALPKRDFAVGEKGSLHVKFVFGGRTGQQRKVVTVRTADGTEQMLEMNVQIAKPMFADPGLVFWRVGDAPASKKIALKVPDGIAARATKVTSNNPRIRATLESSVGEAQAVSVSPDDTSQRESAEVTIETNFPPNAPKSLTVFVRIK